MNVILAVTETISAGANAVPPPSHFSFLHFPSHWPQQGDLISWCQQMSPGTACLLVLAGVVYMMFGWYAFKGLVTLNAAMAGACLGAIIGDRIADAAVIGAIVGGILAAATTWPMMKYAIALMGGVLGALVGAALWRTFNLEQHLVWAGALVGLVMFGMLSFSLFKTSVMMYTSLQGAGMFIFGALALTFKYDSVRTDVAQHMMVKPFILPLAIFIPAMLALIYQQTQYGEGEPAVAKKK